MWCYTLHALHGQHVGHGGKMWPFSARFPLSVPVFSKLSAQTLLAHRPSATLPRLPTRRMENEIPYCEAYYILIAILLTCTLCDVGDLQSDISHQKSDKGWRRNCSAHGSAMSQRLYCHPSTKQQWSRSLWGKTEEKHHVQLFKSNSEVISVGRSSLSEWLTKL